MKIDYDMPKVSLSHGLKKKKSLSSFNLEWHEKSMGMDSILGDLKSGT